MRLIYLADTHIQSGTPENRRDDFFKAISIKLFEVINLCRQFRSISLSTGVIFLTTPGPARDHLTCSAGFKRAGSAGLLCSGQPRSDRAAAGQP
jgi:hypothetical protein